MRFKSVPTICGWAFLAIKEVYYYIILPLIHLCTLIWRRNISHDAQLSHIGSKQEPKVPDFQIAPANQVAPNQEKKFLV